MSFFADLPEPEPQAPQRYIEPEWRRIPNEWVPAGLAIGQLLLRTPETAVVLTGATVYPTGFTFAIVVTRHPEAPPTENGNVIDRLHGHGPGASGDRFRAGVLLDDGRRGSWPDQAALEGRRTPDVAISSRGGSSSNETASLSYFVWPIPPTGDVTLFFLWPAGGLEETSVVIPGDDLRAAAASAAEIWPGAVVPPHEHHRAS